MTQTRLAKISLAVGIACLSLSSNAQKAEPPPPGAYYSAQMPYLPPLPFNPFPEADVVEVEPERFVYDDTQVDYVTLRAWQSESSQMMTAESEPPVPGPGGGGGGTNTPPYIAPTVPIPGVPLLKIETVAGAQIASFESIIGRIYRLEQTTNLNSPVWETAQEFIAVETNSSFVVEAGESGFYRVWQDGDKIQFPDWFDNIYQFMEFTTYTPITSGTIAFGLYTNGVLAFSDSGPIPAGGTVRVYDQNYDPALWPNTGYYEGINEWEFRVTVTEPAGTGGAPGGTTHRIVKKKGIQRNPSGTYYGMTVGQGGIFNPATSSQDEVDESLHFCMSAMYQTCEIVDWNFNLVDVAATDRSWMPGNATLFGPTQWNILRPWVTRQTAAGAFSANYLDYFHYMGHGSQKSIGGAGNFITLKQLEGSPFIKTNYLTYVALDGCQTSKSKDLLKALTGHKTKRSRLSFAAKGENPHFGCGWNNNKGVEWLLQGLKVDNHFYYWEDFYFELTRRSLSTGLMIRNYQQAAQFAKEPMGGGVNNVLQTNPEAVGFEYVGCEDCFFDERPGIVQ